MAYKEVLSIVPFRRLWLGQAISQFGDAFYYLIFVFVVNEITGNPAMVGYVGAIQAIPFLLMSPFAGVIADRVDRRLLMLWSDIISAALLFALGAWVFFQPRPPMEVVFPAAFLLSVVAVFFIPAKSAAVPALVPPDLLMRANALSAATQNFMPLIGISLSGGVLAVVYKLFPEWFFLTAVLVNGVSFLGSAWFIWKLPKIEPKREESPANAWTDFKEGVRFIRGQHVLAMVLAIGFLVNLCVAPFFVVYVTVNSDWFGIPVVEGAQHALTSLKVTAASLPGIGWISGPAGRTLTPGSYGTLAMFEAGFMVGMVIGSVWVGRLKIVRPAIAQVIGLAICGLTILAMAYSPYFWLFIAWNFIAGIFLPLSGIPMNTYMQLVLPDSYRGRVNSVAAMASFAAMPIGMSLAGVLLAQIGAANMFLAMGGAMFVFTVAMLASKQFRNTRMPDASILTEAP